MQIALAFAVSPPRVLALARIVGRRPARETVALLADATIVARDVGETPAHLTITLQSYHDEVVSDPLEIRIYTPSPGRLHCDNMRVFCGTGAHLENISCRAPNIVDGDTLANELVISVRELRIAKTFTFVIACNAETDRVDVELSGAVRPLHDLLPILKSTPLPQLPPIVGRFSKKRRVFPDQATEILSGRAGTTVANSGNAVLFLALMSAAGAYFQLLSLHSQSQTSLLETLRWYDAVFLGTLIFAVTFLFWLVRPTPGVIAQGYLEHFPLRLSSKKP